MNKEPLTIILLLSLLALPALAQDRNCTNFWIDPDTGQQACLPSRTRSQTKPEKEKADNLFSNLDIYGVEAGQAVMTGIIENTADREIEIALIEYELSMQGNVVASGQLLRNTIILKPGERIPFEARFLAELPWSPRGTLVRATFWLDGQLVNQVRPKYNRDLDR